METRDILLLSQPALWTLGLFLALWVYVEALNASTANAWRIRLVSEITALSMLGVAALGGLGFTLLRAAAPVGHWPWAAKLALEAREHLIFVPILLALYLPIVAGRSLTRTPRARAVVMVTAAFIVLSGLAIEAAARFEAADGAPVQPSEQGAQK